MQYDVVVIGGGPGGYLCAARSAQYGLRTALVERDALGGTCLNRGCIPTKTLLHAAALLRGAAEGARFGVRVSGAEADFAALRARMKEVTGGLRDGVAALLRQSGVTVCAGAGFVPAPGQVRVSAPDGAETLLSARSIVLAAGTRPSLPPIPGADSAGVYTSDSLLTELPALRRLTVIGGGVAGVELADAYAAFGAEVTILEAAPRLLPPFDRELAQQLTMLLKKRGIRVETGAAVLRIENGLRCVYDARGETRGTEADGVLIAAGRRTELAALCAPECEPPSERGRILTDEYGRTGLPGLFAIGDITAGRPQLAHAAAAQGEAAAAFLAGRENPAGLSPVPSCVYAAPGLASVGLTESEVRQQYGAAKTGKALMRANGRSVILGQEGFVKLVADGDGVLRGAQLLCASAPELIGEAALAIRLGLTAAEFAAQVRAHPTLEEALGDAAAALRGKYA